MPEPVLEVRMKDKQAALITMRDQVRLQLNGLENQLYLIDQLLNPEPEPPSEPALNSSPDGTV